MSLSKSKCWHSNNCLHFLKHAVPLIVTNEKLIDQYRTSLVLKLPNGQSALKDNLDGEKSLRKNETNGTPTFFIMAAVRTIPALMTPALMTPVLMIPLQMTPGACTIKLLTAVIVAVS
jgi:hypothetical protein